MIDVIHGMYYFQEIFLIKIKRVLFFGAFV